MNEGHAKSDAYVALVICLSFLFTSTGWLSWLYRIVALDASAPASFITMVCGYLLQALGIGAYAWLAQADGALRGGRLAKASVEEGRADPLDLQAKKGRFRKEVPPSDGTRLSTEQRLPSTEASRGLLARKHLLHASLGLYLLLLIPSTVVGGLATTVACGLAANIPCGLIQGAYLHLLAERVNSHRYGTVFGCAYAASTLLTWILSLPAAGMLTSGPPCLVACGAMACIIAWLLAQPTCEQDEPHIGLSLAPDSPDSKLSPEKDELDSRQTHAPHSQSVKSTHKQDGQCTGLSLAADDPDFRLSRKKGERAHVLDDRRARQSHVSEGIDAWPSRALGDLGANEPSTANLTSARHLLALAGATIIMSSVVKTAGFSFPTTDLTLGVNLELSRLLYGVGLVVAGLASDYDRRFGFFSCAMALVMPFLMLALSGYGASGAALWALGYFLTGFYTVFRVLLMVDLANRLDERACIGQANGSRDASGGMRVEPVGKHGLIDLHERPCQHERPCHTGIALSGLLLGRIGDAMGTALCLALSDAPVTLIAVSTVLFSCAMALFLALYQRLYPQASLPVGEPIDQPRSRVSTEPQSQTDGEIGMDSLASTPPLIHSEKGVWQELRALPEEDAQPRSHTKATTESRPSSYEQVDSSAQLKPADELDDRRYFEFFASSHGLTARERDVLRLVLAEHSNSEIAGELFVSEATVKYHVSNLLKKTGCANRLEILSLYLQASEE